MKFNVYMTVKGPGRTVEMEMHGNPVECFNLAGLMVRLANNLPLNETMGVETVGVRIECVEEPGERVKA